jgi:hypothetical protein
MSNHRLTVPPPDAIDYHADLAEQRRRHVLTTLDIGDVLSTIDDLIAAEADPSKHPCFALANWLLERQLTPLDGGQLFDGWKALCWQAIDRLVEQRLQGED